MDRVPLSEVLEHISDELGKANERAQQDGRATMQFSECEIEFAIETEGKGEAGVKIYVLNVGGEVKRSETNTIKVKFIAIPDKPSVNQNITPEPAPKPTRQSRKTAKEKQ